MSQSKPQLRETATRLRKQIAVTEAKLGELRYRLAQTDARLDGSPPPISGLEMLWTAALPTARTRSSKIQCRTEWNRIPIAERPTIAEAIAALKIWNRSEEWKIDNNSYVPGLHKWIKNRQWENLPEVTKPISASARYNPTPKKNNPTDTSEAVTDPEEIKSLLGLK